MSSFVVSQVTLSSETHVAISEVTFERFLTIVDTHVSEKIPFLSECFFTTLNLTNKWTLSCLDNKLKI
jgi:hypothetical protein